MFWYPRSSTSATLQVISLLKILASFVLLWTFCSFTPVFAADKDEPELLFAGLFVNDSELDSADLYYHEDRYWLPLDPLGQWANVHINRTGQKTIIETPLGDALVAPVDLVEMPGGTHIALGALSEAGIKAQFDQQAYALMLYAPWVGIEPQSSALANRPQNPDYYPPDAGLARVYNRFNTSYKDGLSTSGLYSDAMGNLANGVWGLQTTTDQEQVTQLSQLYWHTFDRYVAMRAGTSTANAGGYLSVSDFTGLQLGFSNLSIYNHLASGSSVSRQMFIDDASYTHDISGQGPKGGIAELRLNDRPIARVRIALDGRYLFKRLPIGRGNYDKVEVALYEYSLAQPPIETIDHSIANKPRSVSTGEWLLNTGFGTVGSTVDASTEGPILGYGSVRYGLNNFLTLEAASQYRAEADDGWYLGAIASLGSSLATAIGHSHEGEKDTYDAEIWAQWPSFKANYQAQHEKITDNSEEKHNLSLDLALGKKFNVIARGLLSKENDNTIDEYFVAGFNWRINSRNTFSLRPTNEEEYDARFTHRSNTIDANFQLRASEDSRGISINYALNPAWNLGADYAIKNETETLSAAADYRPRHNNDSIYSAQITQQAEQIGYSLGWRHRLSPRTQFNFSYSRQLETEGELLEEAALTDSESLSVSIESELWFSKNGWRGTGLKTDNTKGAIAAYVFDNDGELLDNKNIRLRIVGAQSNLKPQQDGSQALTGLPPGDYNLELLAEGLPIEYENNLSTFHVRIAPAATTKVNITLKAHYGASGLLTVNGEPASHTWIDVWQDNKRIADGKTDSYGYYQITGLLPGKYELRYQNTKREFELTDDYVFDIDLATISEIPATRALGLANDLNALDLLNGMVDLGTALPSGISGRTYFRGEPLGHLSVQLQHQGRKIASLISDQYGYYSFHHLGPGTYEVSVGSTQASYQVRHRRVYGADIYLDDDSVFDAKKFLWAQP